jgi:hypothetical protein
LSLLASSDPDLRWDFLTPEIIPFHAWFLLKADKKPVNAELLYTAAPAPATPASPAEEVLA